LHPWMQKLLKGMEMLCFYHYHDAFHCPQPHHCSSRQRSLIPMFAPRLFALSMCLLLHSYSCFVVTEYDSAL
jgi:hypothetical protein